MFSRASNCSGAAGGAAQCQTPGPAAAGDNLYSQSGLHFDGANV